MPVLTIRDRNTQSPVDFFYQDSGAPFRRKVYTTLVVVHGFCFHSAAFQRVIPIAASKSFRMVCVNRRDYPGTTPYTPAELKALREMDADEYAAFMEARGEELAIFLYGLIDALSLPGLARDGKEGGLALMGWSMGNMFTLATIASVSSLQLQVQNRLQSYLRKLIMFDSGTLQFGFCSAEGLVEDQTPPQERWSQFAHWVSCYFSHGDLSTRNVDNLEFKVPDLNRKSVAASLSPEEFSSLTDYEAASRSEIYLYTSQTVLFNQMRKALFDPKTRSLWPKLDFWLLHCDSSAGMGIQAAWEIEKLANANKSLPVQILTIEDAHHLVFWDDPEKAVEAFNHCLRYRPASNIKQSLF